MCGITGFVGGGARGDIEKMTLALLHRGPDDGGIYTDDNVALGHRRLSVLDIESGVQPMRDDESGAVIVYNGEIYNHLSIRRELEKTGRVFRTRHSDTETVLRAFLAWGPDCLQRFNGMFAFALYLPGEKKLFLARDRFGEKPLFYARSKAGFAFASEIVALKLWPAFDASVNAADAQRFFAWNYEPGNRTIYKNCASLPPGSWACLDFSSARFSISEYWRFRLNPDPSLTDDKESELIEELRRLLIQAVKRRLLADVPLGVFLSGGIDSGAVLAAATRVTDPAAINSFTIGFREKSFDESDKAAVVAKALGVKNRVRYLTEADVQASIASILAKMSEPFGDASLIPTYHLASFARQSVTVTLSGDGGDELFGGYDPLAAIRPAAYYQKLIPFWLNALLRAFVNRLPASDRNMSLEFKIKRFLRGVAHDASMRLPVWMSGLEPAEIREFFHNPLTADELYEDAVRLWFYDDTQDDMGRAFTFFTSLYLPDDILVKSDRASMMVSLETRAVFLDNDVADFCARLPMRFKYRDGQRKYLLKKAMRGWLPDEIIDRPKKGFGIPLNLWLRSMPEVNPSVPDLKPGVISRCNRLHKRRAGDFRYFLWDLQSFARLSGAA